jgi:cytochrome c-type biogenesis protein
MGGVVLSFAAGALSVLSPCVLPLLPIVVASALQRCRHGPLVLGAGLVLASASVGLFFASLGFTLDVDRDVARAAAATLMLAAGAVLLLPRLQAAFYGLAAPLAARADRLAGRLPAGLVGQFALGALLGVVWTPCTGPTLAAAVTLAAQMESLPHAATVMLGFGVGAVVPILALAYGARRALFGHRAQLAALAAVGRTLLAVVLLFVGALALTGGDKVFEAWMLERMPEWLVDLTTRI